MRNIHCLNINGKFSLVQSKLLLFQKPSSALVDYNSGSVFEEFADNLCGQLTSQQKCGLLCFSQAQTLNITGSKETSFHHLPSPLYFHSYMYPPLKNQTQSVCITIFYLIFVEKYSQMLPKAKKENYGFCCCHYYPICNLLS